MILFEKKTSQGVAPLGDFIIYKLFNFMKQEDFFYEDDNKQVVTFQINEQNLMVNATEMARIFDRQINHFMDTDSTRRFIEACLNSRNSGNLGVKKESDLFVSKQKSGTWMHRILALKFAAWLDPNFEVWVWRLIDQLLFADYHALKQSVKKSGTRRSKIDKLKNDLRSTSTDFVKLEELESEEKAEARNRSRQIVTQIKIFQDVTEEE